MNKASLLKKIGSLVMAVVMMLNVFVPALAADFSRSNKGPSYVALGDGVTLGLELDDPNTQSYPALVAAALAEAGLIDDAEDYYVHANKRYRVEELRYILDSNYDGDAYTQTIGGISTTRRDKLVLNNVVNADVITLNIGVNNFSTYIVNQLMHYLENDGDVLYEYSFDAFAEADVQQSITDIKASVKDLLLSAADDNGDIAIDMIDFVAEVSAYTVLSYVTNFNALISKIYELNPDVQLYVIGLYNPAEGEVMTYDKLVKDGEPIELPIGDFFGAITEIANAYIQIIAPRAFDYTYVDPGAPELLIDRMGNTSLTDEERIPNGLIYELAELAGESAIDEVVEIFADYGIEKTTYEAQEFLDGLLECRGEEERKAFIKGEIENEVVKEVKETFKTELLNYLGQFANNTDNILDENDITDLLADLEAVAGDADAMREVAGDFVDDIISDPDLQNQAAANVIYGYIEEYGLSGYVTVDNVVELLDNLSVCANEAEREAVADAWVKDLAATKIAEKVQGIVGDSNYSVEDARDMLDAMDAAAEKDRVAVAREYLYKDAFRDYMAAKIKEAYDGNGLTLTNYATYKDFADAIENADDASVVVRAEIRAAAAKVAADEIAALNIFGAPLTSGQIAELFQHLDNGTKTIDAWVLDMLKAQEPLYWEVLYPVVGGQIEDALLNAYNQYSDAADVAENAVESYIDGLDTASDAFSEFASIKESVVTEILKVYEENYVDGELNLGNFADFNELKNTAVDKIVNGYDEYVKAIDAAMGAADSFDEYLDPVYSLLKDLAEIEVISLNDLLSVSEKTIKGGQSYISDMVDNLLTNQTLADDEMTVAYLALRYYLADSMMLLPTADGHDTIADRVVAAINGEDMSSTAGNLANKVIDLGIDIYHLAKEFLKKPATGSGQATTLINPDAYVALGDNVTSGTALSSGTKTYVQLLADALAMEFNDVADYDDDKINNLAINGMRTEELLAIVTNNYNGDAYTAAKFDVASMRAKYKAAIVDAELITIEIGINNLVTFPMTQALLAYNGQDVYEMDWTQYFSESRVNKVYAGRDMVMDLLLYIADNADSRVKQETGKSAYDECVTALNTLSVAMESFAYGVLGYVVNLDASVEAIAEMNPDATIVLVGFYNPLVGTEIDYERTFNVAGKNIDLDVDINVSALAQKVINQANRFLTNYVGFLADDVTAANDDSRIVTVGISKADLCISDSNVSKNLADLKNWKTVSVLGKNITIKVPVYLYETLSTGGSALHPNATGHAYISQQILNALDYEIHADVVVDDDWKYYGDADPEFTYTMDDESSLYDIIVEFQREQGENVGKYTIFADVTENSGYYEVDVETGVLEIVARPVKINVIIENGLIKDVEFDDDVLAREGVDVLNIQYANGEVTYDNDNYDVEIVVDETNGTIKYNGSTLSLVGEVFINSYFKVSGFDDVDMSTDSGMLIWYSEPNLEDAVITNTAAINKVGLVKSEKASWGWGAQTDGFAAAEYADEIYIRGYIKVGDNYFYSELKEFSVQDYAEAIIAKNNEPALVDTCIALLHYGAEAQIRFGYNTGDLANASIVAQYPPEKWNDELLTDLDQVNTNIAGSTEVEHKGKTLSLNAATQINYYYTFTGEATEYKLLVWNDVSGQLTKDNVSYSVDMELQANGWYKGKSDICPAALYSKTVFACAYFVDAEGNEYYSDVIAFSPEEYTSSVIERNTVDAEVCKKMVIFGEYARIYFGK